MSEETRKEMKQNLKMAILAANNDKSMPPVYYLLKNKFTDSECAVAKTHELPKELGQDDPRLLPSYTTDLEATPPVPLFDDENRSQPPFTFPVQIPSIPPISDRAFEFYNNNVKVLIHEC